MLPLARTALRRIGTAPTSSPTSAATPGAGSPRRSDPTRALEHLPPGVDTDRFGPDEVGACRTACPLRTRRAPGRGLRVAAGAAQGAGHVDPGAARRSAQRVARRRAGHRRRRPVPSTLRRLAHSFGVAEHVVFTDGVPVTNCPRTTRWPTCSRCRAAPAARAWTSRASASSTWRRRPPECRWSPGDSGGAPETVLDGETGRGRRRLGRRRHRRRRSATCSPTRTGRRGWAPAGRRWVVDTLAVAHPGAATWPSCSSARRRGRHSGLQSLP